MKAEATAKWYETYYARRGADRNDILSNPGVLFQSLALQRSIVEALRAIRAEKRWKVLDVGCGSGGSLAHLLSYGFQNLHGVDILPERIAEARARYPSIEFAVGDAARMEYAEGSFDMVMESTMFIQLQDEAAAPIAAEMLRVCRPGGFILLADWRYSYGRPEYKALSRERIKRLFRVGEETEIVCVKAGALVPPLGRFLSAHMPALYFPCERIFPFAVGEKVTVLRRACL